MARVPSLIDAAERAERELEPATGAGSAAVPMRRKQSNAGKYHLSAYFDFEDPLVRDFRRVAADTHRSNQDLLREALEDLINKHKAAEAFGR